jgi:hypothetical protein
MHFDTILHAFRTKPTVQRLVMAFAVGLFLSCAAGVSEHSVGPSDDAPSASSIGLGN